MEDELWTFEPHDLDRLTNVITEYSNPDSLGYNAFVEPEPTTTKGRFGRTKEQSTDYTIGFMYSPEPAGLMMQISTPAGDAASRLRSGTPTAPQGWTEHPEASGDVIVFPGAPDARATAEWIVSALQVLGAPLPTGNFRGYAPRTVKSSHYHS